MIKQNISLTHGTIPGTDRVEYRNSKGVTFICHNTTLAKCIECETKEGNSILWYTINRGEKVSLG